MNVLNGIFFNQKQMDSESEWTLVTKKQKKIKNPNKLPVQKFLSTWTNHVSINDYTLTPKEKDLIEQEKQKNEKLIIFCRCCCCELISDIIHRTITTCESDDCFCCSNYSWIRPRLRYERFHYYNKNYHYTMDHTFT